MRKNYATQGAVQPGPVFLEDAKGNSYDMAGNIIPPAQDPVTDALSVARRETVNPYLMVPGHENLTRVPPVAGPRPEYVRGEAVSAATQPSRDVFWQGVEQFRNPQTEPRTPARAWELLSGAGQVGLGAIGTGFSGAIGAGVEMLPTWLTGPQNQRNKLASDLNEMAMFADPMMGPEALAATAPLQRVGGIKNAAAIEGDLAKQRMLERGPSKFYDPLRVSSGVDPTQAGKALANAKDAAIAKVGDAIDPALKAAQEATGGDQVAAATRAAQIEALNPVPPPQGIAPPTNALQTERGARTVISPTSIRLTPQEQAVVNSFKSRADRAIVASRIRETKARYPKSDGWASFEAVGAEFDDKGNPVIKWRDQSYGFNTGVQAGNRTVTDPVTGEKTQIQVNEPRGLRPGTPQYESQARKATRNGVKEVEDIIRRAGEGDENALRIIRQAGWYREFMRKGFDERGGSYPAFSDLLGATSPNTAVDQNYRYSVDLQNRFARGDFDDQTAFARDYQGSLNNFPENKLIYRNPVGPKGPQKLQYGMNSRNAQMALADKWRTKEQGQAPKARNFSGNLGGATDQATIDVWAARFINRVTGRKRLPPPVESGVKGQLGSNLEPTGEFGFGQDVFRRITDELNRKGDLLPYLQELGYDSLTPMDMQALTWFIEKERWTKNNWTTSAGEGGSFEDELMRYPSERWQSGVSIQQADPPGDAAMASTRNVFENSLRDDPNVNQYRVHPTIGRYAGNNERSFDLELTAKPGWNPQTWMAAVIREAKANNQYDVFFSKRLPPEIAQSNQNARPGVEIYFRDRKTLDQALPILEEFTNRNADGFTFVTDLRLRERELGGKEAPDFVGVRMQWVPEIRMRWDDDFRNAAITDPNALDLASDEALNAMQNALNALDKAGLGIVDARVHHYDTLTIGKESYDKFLDGIADPENAIGSYEGGAGAPVDPVKRFGQPIRSHAEGRDRALRTGSEGGQSDASGDVVGAGQSSGPVTPEQRTANFNTSFGNTVLRTPQGEPMRLYHLTPNDITEFSASPTNRAGPVVYLSPYPEFQPAHHQAGVTGERGEFTGAFREGANVMPVYADVRNPLVLDHPRKIKEAAAKYQKGDREFPRYVSPEAKAAMEADGYDAIIFGGENPIPYGDRPMDARLGHQEARDEEFIIFDPGKIKSATGNRGTYDMTTPNITKALGGAIEDDDDDIYHAVRLARDVGGSVREGYAGKGAVTDPYADEVASAKALMAEKQYDDQPWGEWAGDAVGNALNTAKAILPTALGGRGEVGLSDMARGTYEAGKDAVTFPGDVISGKQALYDESGRPLEQAVGRSFNTVGTVGGASSLVPVPDNSLRVFGAYHVSPHDFDKFEWSPRTSKTGEGNQSYGAGLYFAENPSVSGRGGDYWRQFFNKMKSGPERTAAGAMFANKFELEKAINALESGSKYHVDRAIPGRYGDGPEIELGHKLLADESQQALDILRGGQIAGPRTYEVDINADPESFLDWYKPLFKQPAIREKLLGPGGLLGDIQNNQYAMDYLDPHINGEFDSLTGRELNSVLARLAENEYLPTNGPGVQQHLDSGAYSPAASSVLRNEGIPGIKYLDAGSRGAGEGTRNYVIFNDKLIDIKDKYADGGEVDDDIYHAVRLARDVGGATNENPQVFLTDAQGRQYDAQGKPIQPTATQEQSNSAATQAAPTPEQVGRRAAEDPATFDAMMQKYAIPDRDVAEYEALQTAVRKQPQEVQQMTHVGAPPMRDIKVDMPLFGGEYNAGQAPYNVADPLSGMAQTAYDFKTAPLYMAGVTAPLAAGMDVAEGVATGDPMQASMAALHAPGKLAKGAIIGLSNFAMDPAQAQAGPARWFSKALEVAREIPMNKMTGEQALAMLRKATSPEEIRWTGAEKFLSSRPQVSKSELVDYLNKNRVQTEKIVRGGTKPTNRDDIVTFDDDILQKYGLERDRLMNEFKLAGDRRRAATDYKEEAATDYKELARLQEEESQKYRDWFNFKNTMVDAQIEKMGGLGLPLRYGPGSKFGDRYSTPGGEDYRETLISLPPERNVYKLWPVVGGDGLQHGRYVDPESAQMAASRIAGGTVLDPVEQNAVTGYYGHHWSEPNVVAHIRSQMLTSTPEGANRPFKVYSMDETQSDMAQDARKYGVKMSEEERKAIRNRIDQVRQERAKYIGSTDLDERSKYDFLAKEEDDLLKKYNENEKKAVKESPYIGSTQGWTDLAVKKALDDALDSGAEYFTFTPGEVQADRYSLARDLSHIEYEPDIYGSYTIRAVDKNGKTVLEKDMDADEIEEYFSKEIAKKIKSDEGRKMEDRPLRDWRILENEQIKAKGDKMVDYYENIYKRRVLKVIKDATGKKASWERIPVDTANGVRMQDAIRIDDMQDARFSDFNKGGRVTGGNPYGNDDPAVSRAIALTREY